MPIFVYNIFLFRIRKTSQIKGNATFGEITFFGKIFLSTNYKTLGLVCALVWKKCCLSLQNLIIGYLIRWFIQFCIFFSGRRSVLENEGLIFVVVSKSFHDSLFLLDPQIAAKTGMDPFVSVRVILGDLTIFFKCCARGVQMNWELKLF